MPFLAMMESDSRIQPSRSFVYETAEVADETAGAWAAARATAGDTADAWRATAGRAAAVPLAAPERATAGRSALSAAWVLWAFRVSMASRRPGRMRPGSAPTAARLSR